MPDELLCLGQSGTYHRMQYRPCDWSCRSSSIHEMCFAKVVNLLVKTIIAMCT